MKKRKEDAKAGRALLGDKLSVYNAVRKANLRAKAGRPLNPAALSNIPQEESDFYSVGDFRTALAHNQTDLESKMNLSSSFITDTFRCEVCDKNKGHPVGCSREMFLLTDQSYPAILPSTSQLNC
jgi:hypothetical protein